MLTGHPRRPLEQVIKRPDSRIERPPVEGTDGAAPKAFSRVAEDAHQVTWCRIPKPCINSGKGSYLEELLVGDVEVEAVVEDLEPLPALHLPRLTERDQPGTKPYNLRVRLVPRVDGATTAEVSESWLANGYGLNFRERGQPASEHQRLVSKSFALKQLMAAEQCYDIDVRTILASPLLDLIT
jgi:hypothetical protein